MRYDSPRSPEHHESRDEQDPNDAHRESDRHRGQRGDGDVECADRDTRYARSSSSTTIAASGRYRSPTVASPTAPSAAMTAKLVRVTVRIDPNRYWNRSTFNAPAAETRTTPAAIPV